MKKKHETIIDLSGQNLAGSNLEGCNLSDANLKDSVISVDQLMKLDYITSESGFNNEVGRMIFSAIGFEEEGDSVKLIFAATSEIPKKNLIGMIDVLRKRLVKTMKEEK